MRKSGKCQANNYTAYILQAVRIIAVTVLLICGLSFAAEPVLADQTITDTKMGTIDGLNYELWKDNGTTQMVLKGGGEFSCSWSNINNALFRIGKKFDNTKTYDQIGNISLEYKCDYKPNGNSYLCVYGWSSNPLVEYYIVDSWGSWRPPVGAAPGQNCLGQITVDGGTYDVYKSTRVNQPSIEGNTTFEQYWSVRTEKRSSGTVSVTEHFKAWEKLGLKLGTLYEASLTVEGYQSSGQADVTKNVLNIGGNSGNSADVTVPGQDNQNGNWQDNQNQNGNWQDNQNQNGNGQDNQNGNWQDNQNQNGNGQDNQNQNGNGQDNQNQNGNGQDNQNQNGNWQDNHNWNYNGQDNQSGKQDNSSNIDDNGIGSKKCAGILFKDDSFKSGSKINTKFDFATGTGTFVLRAVNPSSKTVKVKLYVGGKYRGTFKMAKGTSEYMLADIATGTGKRKVELRYSGNVKLKINALAVFAATGLKKGKTLPVKLQCENMKLDGPYAGRTGNPFGGAALYGNGDSCSATVFSAGGKYSVYLCGASNNDRTAKADLYVNGVKKGTFAISGTKKKSVRIKDVELTSGINEIKILLSADDGSWDLYADYVKIK